MNNPPVENETRGMADASHADGQSTAAGGRARPGTADAGGQEALFGPFSLRDTVVGGSVLVMLVGSILPFFTVSSLRFEEDFNLWNGFSLFFLGIGILLPLVVAGLFAGRRLAPGTKPRVGSLSLDQFASVVAVLALAFFFIQTVTDFAVGPLIALIGSLGLVAATTLAPHLPFFAKEFEGRPERTAAPMAREALPLRARPARPKAEAPAARRFTNPIRRSDAGTGQAGAAHQAEAQQGPAVAAGGGVVAGAAAGASAAAPQTARPADNVQAAQDAHPAAQAPTPESSRQEPLAATTVNPVVRESENPAAENPAAGAAADEPAEPITATRDESEAVVEAFWFAVGTPRQIVDERTGLPLFMFHPGDWELGLEDRGDEFLVQDKRTGRIGVLRDLSNIERVDAEQ
ncbi:hypothetical protein LJ754_03275 [Arthrobacter sp. zg-Y40]|uniref:hypothetical protein n=1 Tax=unclassified Arthrobacter TaxID=235627 RepID=UPI001D1577BD|nr:MULTISPECIES: hypothetical protein [unclassified Arthrobacter]MCC3278182.1 hypothetical protein [Arthrobacter sp. zg-Y40]MDK1326746.1 hypothetical protein [Arthrobacter sp. zg-Y1143]